MRRAFALLGFFAVLALALALLYRVYLHHETAEPYVKEETSLVQSLVRSMMDGEAKISRHLG